MYAFIKKELPFLLLSLAIIAYSIYFSFFTILRNEKMYAHYFDLGIMHQTVHNTYMAMRTGDMSRVLELTNPHEGYNQVKRMAIHNDILLGFLAPFYFIHDGPETLLVIQSLGVALGALFIFLIAEKVLVGYKNYAGWLSCVLGIAYLLYPPLQKANTFEFHAVTLAPCLLLGMYWFWLIKKYIWSLLFAVFAIFSKEQVGLVTGFFALYVLYQMGWRGFNRKFYFTIILGLLSFIWVVVSMAVIIPSFRGSAHFGTGYYSYLSENPLQAIPFLLRGETFRYLHELFSPLWYLPILSPAHLAIAIPEFAVVLLSANDNMRNTYFHYDAVLTAFIFLAAIYSVRNQIWLSTRFNMPPLPAQVVGGMILIPVLIASYTSSNLPWSRGADFFPWKPMPAMVDDMHYWRTYLQDDYIKVSTTGHLAPHFAGRQYFYDFSNTYPQAEYILIDTHEVRNGFSKKQTIPAYDALQSDSRYVVIYNNDGLEVYKRLGRMTH